MQQVKKHIKSKIRFFFLKRRGGKIYMFICNAFSIGADTLMQLILHLKFLSKYEEYDDERSNRLFWQEYHQVREEEEMNSDLQTSFSPRYGDFECNCVITSWLEMVLCRHSDNDSSSCFLTFLSFGRLLGPGENELGIFCEKGERFIRNDIWKE